MSSVKIGFGFYRHMLNREHYRFARQCGATHGVVHLTDYFHQGSQSNSDDQPVGDEFGWGLAGNSKGLWESESLTCLKQEMAEEGIELAALENFDPADWSDVLLDGPRRDEQIEGLKQKVRNAGAAGIPVIGYNFSIAGVSGRTTGAFARGEAISVGAAGVDERPIPRGMVWNMRIGELSQNDFLPEIDHAELWSRLEYFLREILPVAESAGVRLAAHPDDPPFAYVRRQPRLVYQPAMYRRLIEIDPRPANALELCLGTLQEMTEGDVYAALEEYTRENRVAYIHFRNVVGKVPEYREVFLDEGDLDMARVIEILERNRFDGLLIPDHTPQMSCTAPWHAGMAWAMGYMRALLKTRTEEG